MAVVLILLFFLMLNLLVNAGEISKVFAVPIPVSLHLKSCLPMFGYHAEEVSVLLRLS